MTYHDYLDIVNKFSGSIVAGTNENGERVIIEHYDEDEPYFKVTTFQNNDWIRINYFYKDGSTEEIYER